MEAGKQLLLSADSGAEAVLQAELTEIQERWKIVSTQLEQQKKQLALLLKVSVQFLLYFFSKFVIFSLWALVKEGILNGQTQIQELHMQYMN